MKSHEPEPQDEVEVSLPSRIHAPPTLDDSDDDDDDDDFKLDAPAPVTPTPISAMPEVSQEAVDELLELLDVEPTSVPDPSQEAIDDMLDLMYASVSWEMYETETGSVLLPEPPCIFPEDGKISIRQMEAFANGTLPPRWNPSILKPKYSNSRRTLRYLANEVDIPYLEPGRKTCPISTDWEPLDIVVTTLKNVMLPEGFPADRVVRIAPADFASLILGRVYRDGYVRPRVYTPENAMPFIKAESIVKTARVTRQGGRITSMAVIDQITHLTEDGVLQCVDRTSAPSRPFLLCGASVIIHFQGQSYYIVSHATTERSKGYTRPLATHYSPPTGPDGAPNAFLRDETCRFLSRHAVLKCARMHSYASAAQILDNMSLLSLFLFPRLASADVAEFVFLSPGPTSVDTFEWRRDTRLGLTQVPLVSYQCDNQVEWDAISGAYGTVLIEREDPFNLGIEFEFPIWHAVYRHHVEREFSECM
jgi:hypothetical protein